MLMQFSNCGRNACILTSIFIENASLKGGVSFPISRAFFMALSRAESVFGKRRYGIAH